MTPRNAGKTEMTEDLPPHRGLLPAGFGDTLPPDAAREAHLIETLMHRFDLNGYQRVQPPLVEFETTLLSGAGAALGEQIYRIMDPESQRMMGLRADTTPQIARIATTRMAGAPRPLRLAYAGPCLLVRGTQMAPERQVSQAGIELIGPDLPQADAEAILVAADALRASGIGSISIDLTMPPLIPALIGNAALGAADRAELAHALDRKDAAAIARHGGDGANSLCTLLDATGLAPRALDMIAQIDLPKPARALADRLAAIVACIAAADPDLRVTIDPVEFRGYRYHTGAAVTIFAPGRQVELGRGGRYLCENGESATGITLYPDTALRVAPKLILRARLYLPADAPVEAGAAARAQGFATIAGLSPVADLVHEAGRLGCSHLWRDGAIIDLSGV
jgi:ATP phosphoribosyltransferase regulatory subunit